MPTLDWSLLDAATISLTGASGLWRGATATANRAAVESAHGVLWTECQVMPPFMLKSASGDELVRAVKAIHKGEPVLAPVIAKKVMNYFKLPDKVPLLEEDTVHLSERELDIVRLAAKGLTNKDIADRLHLSYRTIEGHLRDIFNKLGVGSRTEAVLHGLKQGWFTLEELV